MPVTPARDSAFRILLQVEKGARYAVDLLQAPRVSRLKDADRRLTTEIVMGVLRRRGDLDSQIEKLSGRTTAYFDPEVLEILRMGVYQIRYLDSVPAHAAVSESVELVKQARKKSAAGLVNAVLRKCGPRKAGAPSASFGDHEELESARRSTPAWLYERWRRNYGEEAADTLSLASFSAPRIWLRVTGVAPDRESVASELEQEGVRTRPGAFSRRALSVESGSVVSSRAWREGRVMIQDEASQLVAELVKPEPDQPRSPHPGARALDLCAAPGMKALQIAEAMKAGTLVACDRSLGRLKTFGKILSAAWPGSVQRCCVDLDASHPLPFTAQFDRVLADVPCSGTGTLARNPEIKWRLRPEDIPRLAELQFRILCRGVEALSSGGRLVYSTCSLEPEENEQVVRRALDASPGYRQLSSEELNGDFAGIAQFIGDDGAFRTIPGCEPLDGLFAAVLVRD